MPWRPQRVLTTMATTMRKRNEGLLAFHPGLLAMILVTVVLIGLLSLFSYPSFLATFYGHTMAFPIATVMMIIDTLSFVRLASLRLKSATSNRI
jgi:hypothetical protein